MTAYDFVDQPYIEYLVKGIMLGTNSRHLWYLLALFNIFIFINGYQHLFKKNRISAIILLLIGITGALVYDHTIWIFAIGYFFEYILYFVIGMYFRTSIFEGMIETNPRLWAVASLGGNIIFTFLLSNKVADIVAALFGIIFMYSASNLKICRKANIQSTIFGKNTFGIYLAHPMIIYIMMYYYKRTGLENILTPLIFVPIVVVSSIYLSLLITLLLRKIRFGFALGEPVVG